MSFLGIEWGVRNMLSCEGFQSSASGMSMGPVGLDIGGPCSMAKLGLVFLFFIIAIARKWGGEEMGVSFSFLWANVFGLGAYILVMTFTGEMRFAMIAGIAGMLAGGYGAGFMFEDAGGEPNYE
jgi:hypothetical protein